MSSVQVQSEEQKATVVSLNNMSSTNMVYYVSNNWSGSLAGSYPKTILAHGSASFSHLKGVNGSKTAVQYALGKDAAGNSFSVIIAWDAPPAYDPSTSPNMVFVISGPDSVIYPIDWPEVELLLNDATSSSSSYGVNATISHQPEVTALVVVNIELP